MSSIETKNKWHDLARRSLTEIDDLLDMNPFDDWKTLQRPHSRAEGEFESALILSLGAPDSKFIKKFLERALKVIERSFREKKYEHGRAKDAFPMNRGQLHRIRYFAQEMSKPGSGDQQDLQRASDDIWQWYSQQPQRTFWARADVQGSALGTGRLALLAGDLTRVDRTLNPKWPYRHHKQELEILNGLRDCLAHAQIPNKKLQEAIEKVFDEARVPGYDSDTEVLFVRIELAGLREKYVLHPGDAVNWQRALEAIAR